MIASGANGNGFNGGLGLRALSEDKVKMIHAATLSILEQTGVFIEDDEARAIFESAGATVDEATKIVKIPARVVGDAIASAPEEVLLAGRLPQNDRIAGGNKVCFVNFSGHIRMVDPFTGDYRESTKADVAATARLGDALSELDIYSRAVNALDVPPATMPLHNAEAFLANTTKHCVLGPETLENAQGLIQMADCVCGGEENRRARPIMSLLAVAVSPLKWHREACRIVMAAARAGMPVGCIAMAMSGGSAPATAAGTVVIANAEILAGITLAQLTHKGAPVIFASYSTGMDLRLGTSPLGSPELARAATLAAQMGHFYKIPTWVPGVMADSKTTDSQAAHEKTLTGLMTALAGANVITGMGGIESGMAFDAAQAVIDNEIVRMIRHTIQPLEVSEETLVVDAIREVGQFGNFLEHDSTFDHMHETSRSILIDRGSRENWLHGGSSQMAQRALAKAQEILQNHEPEPLPAAVQAELKRIVQAADEAAESRQA